MGLKHMLSDGLAKRCRALLCIFRVAGQGYILAGYTLDRMGLEGFRRSVSVSNGASSIYKVERFHSMCHCRI